jgi:solute carrier family 25 thiamine pyrophosphate transporter 19|eukprot:m.150934 g.150934  ORF g.150934 m.150934 type:complete len:300 (-) comp23337_c1_seq1:593-1492(-)
MSSQPSTKHAATAGAVSGAVTRALLQPLDVLKIRMQLVVAAPGAPTQSLISTLTEIVHVEGVRALWKGHSPAQALSVTYGGVGFAAYAHMCTAVGLDRSTEKKASTLFSQNFLVGGVAGMAATIICHPLDTLRTRVVADRGNAGLHQVVVGTYASDGMGGFYRGATPSLLLIFPYSGLQFGYYMVIRRLFDRVEWLEPLQPAEAFLCGAGAGLLAKLNVLPLDMMKKRLQMQGVHLVFPRYSGLFHCFSTILAVEGIAAFFRGAGPASLKAALTSATIFAVYDRTLQFLASRESELDFS